MADTIGTATTPNSDWGTYYQAGSGDDYFGNIQEISIKKDSFLVPLEAVGLGYGSDSTENDDTGGALLTFTLTIEKTSTTTAAMKTFIGFLLGLVNGQQDKENGYPFAINIDMVGGFSVKVMSVDILAVVPSENVMTYVIRLVESGE